MLCSHETRQRKWIDFSAGLYRNTEILFSSHLFIDEGLVVVWQSTIWTALVCICWPLETLTFHPSWCPSTRYQLEPALCIYFFDCTAGIQGCHDNSTALPWLSNFTVPTAHLGLWGQDARIVSPSKGPKITIVSCLHAGLSVMEGISP